MKTLFLLAFLATFAAHGDEFIQYNNGATAWRNDQGHTYGYAGGTDNGSGGFNDVKTGERYENINNSQSVNTRTGQPIDRPFDQYDDHGRYRYNR